MEPDAVVSTQEEDEKNECAETNGGAAASDTLSPESPEQPDGAPRPRKKWLFPLAAGLVVLVLTVFALPQAGKPPVVVREPGAWPDFPYLASLVDEPDAFVRAVNSEELSDAYRQAKMSGSWDDSIDASIDIDDLSSGASVSSGSEQAVFNVIFTGDGKIDYFQLIYYGEEEPTMPVEAGGDYVSHMTVMAGFRGATLGVAPLDDFPKGAVQTVYNECRRSNSVVEGFLSSPDDLAERCGIDPETIVVENECYGVADWRSGYLLACAGYYQASASSEMPVVLTGTAYEKRFVAEEAEGSYLMSLQSADQFAFTSTKATDLAVQNAGVFTIAYGRNLEDPGQGTENVENTIAGQATDYAFSLWSFAEGKPTT
uniref:hypothetical protein n=1 Tax=Olsenella timonensis TaxID=1805478 RepID=UPI00094E720F|nr:hypothetical protein [Olsenella timonensis]